MIVGSSDNTTRAIQSNTRTKPRLSGVKEKAEMGPYVLLIFLLMQHIQV